MLSIGFPWFFMITTNLGTWTGVGTYPGPEAAFVNGMWMLYYDSCQVDDFIEVHYGGMTTRGFPVTPDSFRPWQASEQFLDTASNYSKSQGPFPPPYVGVVLPTLHLTYVNIF